MKKNLLSGILLAHRDDVRLKHALDSLNICTEVIIIDNNSGVDWKSMQKKLDTKLKVIKHDQSLDNFARAKNKGIESVTTQWVLLLDSDEVLPEKTQKEILNLISQNLYDVVHFPRTDIFLQKKIKYGEAGTVFLPRLFKTNQAKFTRPVHEVLASTGRVGQATNHILHYSHQSVSEFLQKICRYAKIEADFQSHTSDFLLPKLLFFPIGKFLVNFFFKLGFLDGYRGLVYAVMMSLHSFFVRVYAYEKK